MLHVNNVEFLLLEFIHCKQLRYEVVKDNVRYDKVD